MASDLGELLLRIKSMSSQLLGTKPLDKLAAQPEEAPTAEETFEEALKNNFTKFGGELCSSSGNINFEELTSGGDFHKAGFNKMNPRIAEALTFLVKSVFK